MRHILALWLWIDLLAGGVVTVDVYWHHATYGGVLVWEGEDGLSRPCIPHLGHVRCTVVAGPSTQIAILIEPRPQARCNETPHITGLVDGAVVGGMAAERPAELRCVYLPLAP